MRIFEDGCTSFCWLFNFYDCYDTVMTLVSVADDMVSGLRATVNNCVDRIKLLFVFKQLLLGESKPLRSRKLHMLLHCVTWLENFGSLLGQDTERWEAYLKDCGKDIYRTSQNRRSNIPELMMKKVKNLHLVC